jgi:DNA-binding FadR family transcriptional regulator
MSAPPTVGVQGRQVASLILSELASAGLGSGGRLPTERQLAERFGVTRSAVRHGLSLLQAEGLVSREVGRGTFLRDAADRIDAGVALPAELDDVAPADVMTVRHLLEPPAMSLVAIRATTRDFEGLDAALAANELAQSYEDFETSDVALHRRLIDATHNPLLIRLYGLAEAARGGQLWGDLKRRADSPQVRMLYREEHRRLLSAIRARDGAGAVLAMREHLDSVRSNLLGDG